MVVTRSNKIGDSESIASNASNASRIPRPKTTAKAKSKSSTSYLYDESDDVPSVDSRHPPPIVTVTPPTPFSHSTGMKIPAQSSGSTDQDDERLPHDQHVEDPDDLSLKDHPTSVQEHSLRAGGTDPLREDLPSGQEHPLQGDESDPLREDLNLVLDQHRQQGDSDPLRKDPPSVLDPSLRAGDSDPLRRDQLTNPPVDDLHVEGTDSPRRSPRASLSGPSLRPDGVHPLRKDHVSTVPSSHLQEEDDSWRKSLSFPGWYSPLQARDLDDPPCRDRPSLVREHRPQPDLQVYDTVHLHPDQRQLEQESTRRQSNDDNDYIDLRSEHAQRHPDGTSSLRGHGHLYPAQSAHRSTQISTGRHPGTTEPVGLVPLPSRIGQERHQQRSLMVNDRQPRQVSSVHHDHHEYRDQRSGGHVQHPQLRGQRTTFTEANGSHDLSIQQRCLESQEDRQPPQQRFGYQEDGREHRLRQTILSSLRASDDILYHDLYLEMITQDRELVNSVLQDEHLRPIFLSHPRIIEKSMQDHSFLATKHGMTGSEPHHDSQQRHRHSVSIPGSILPASSSTSYPRSGQTDDQRPQQPHGVIVNPIVNDPPVGRYLPVEHRPINPVSINDVNFPPSSLLGGNRGPQRDDLHHVRGSQDSLPRRATTKSSNTRS